MGGNTDGDQSGNHPALLDHALTVGGLATKKETVTTALREFIARREQSQLQDLFGTLEWSPDCDYKADRTRATDDVG